MRRRDILRGLALTPLVPSLAGSALAAPEDALNSYREAIRLLPVRSEASKAILKDVLEAPLGRAARELVQASGPSLDLLLRGASATSCEWGDTWTGPVFDVTRWLGDGADLARIATLRARLEFDDGRHAPALVDILAAYTLGRHIVRGSVLIAQLIGLSIEQRTIEIVAASLPRLDRATLLGFQAQFVALPGLPGLADTIRAERAFFLGYVRPNEPDAYDDAKAKIILDFYDRLIEAASRSDAALEAVGQGSTDDMKTLVSYLNGLRRAWVYIDVRRAMLRAAIAMIADGIGAIDRVPDPSDGRPFDLKSWVTGFELTSRFALEGKPKARLVVGAR